MNRRRTRRLAGDNYGTKVKDWTGVRLVSQFLLRPLAAP